MCGISAVIDRAGSAGAAAQLMRMHAKIRHRGPDGERFVFFDANGGARPVHDGATPIVAAMAFRRLNVIDISDAASQPMSSPDGQVWIAFNGEIYNFVELRARLVSQGRTFATRSDTEVALAAYEAWGTRCFEELDGMWGIVIVDLRRRVVVLSRDRFGIKPLHWTMDGERILVASEVKQLVSDAPRAQAPIVAAFLRGNRVPVLDETFFEGITPLPVASFIEIPLDERGAMPSPQTYWDFRAIAPRGVSEREYAQCVDEVEARLRHAVATHSVADVNVGYLLSGGLDSSLLTAIAAKDIAPTPAFSFGFRDPRLASFSELQYAESVARRYGLTLHEATFDEAWVAANAGRVIHAMDEPVLGMAALAQFRIFELCRERGMTVVVDGEASDEVFAGYPSYQVNLLRDYIDRRDVISFTRELRAMARYEERSTFAVVRDLFRSRYGQKAHGIAWLDPAYGSDASRIAAARAAFADHGAAGTSRVSRLLFRSVHWGNVKIVLGYTDRVSMASSIEARVPYLDRALVELAFSLPDEFKAGRGQRKRILRDVARRYLPPDVTERKDRMGFGTPDELFIRGAMWNDVEARVRSIANAPMFVRGGVARLLEAFAARQHNDVRAIWRIYALARWAEEFRVAL